MQRIPLNFAEVKRCQDSLSFYPGFSSILKNAYFMAQNYQDQALKDYYQTHLITLSNLTSFKIEDLNASMAAILGLNQENNPKTDTGVFWIKTKIQNNCIFTPARIFSKEIDFVFDTGCSTTMINYQWLKVNGFLDKPTVKFLGTENVKIANGSNQSYLKATGIEFEFAGQMFIDNIFLLTDGPFLLGNDIIGSFRGFELDNVNQQIKLKQG